MNMCGLPIKGTTDPEGKRVGLRTRSSAKSIFGTCVRVCRTSNQSHFHIKSGDNILSIGEGTRVVKIS
ncbi:MAG: hypothetical protein RBS86_00225 [Candidatus Moranbacteria bacterium]|jgi:hypothetical protein|nr:hypothetical protein [Candidatus Moranbacteria bacterium]